MAEQILADACIRLDETCNRLNESCNYAFNVTNDYIGQMRGNSIQMQVMLEQNVAVRDQMQAILDQFIANRNAYDQERLLRRRWEQRVRGLIEETCAMVREVRATARRLIRL